MPATTEDRMKTLAIAFGIATAAANARESIPNPEIDYEGFERIVHASKDERESHRLSEAQFLAMVNASLYDNCSQVDGA
jgi:hypothetical protein